MKLSYSCMPSMEKLITAENQSILRREVRTSSATDNACNCQQPNACPVDGKCLNEAEGIVYQAIVTREDNSDENSYVGLTEGKLKTRHTNHNTSFRHDKYRNSTELSNSKGRRREIFHQMENFKEMQAILECYKAL